MALVCAAKGYRCRIVIADCFTEERFQLMRALGAQLEVIQSVEGRPRVTAEDIRRMVEHAGKLAAEPGHYATDQFNNPYVIPGHRDHLGREIWEQTDGRVTAFCHGIGTASSLVGVSQALRPHGVHVQAARAGRLRRHLRDGSSRRERAVSRCRARGRGWCISTGANVVGALRLAERLGPDAVVVTLAVDTGFKYTSVAPYAEQ